MNNSSVINTTSGNGTSPRSFPPPVFGKMEWIFGIILSHSVLALFIIVSNVVVLYAFSTNARLRTTTNSILMSMALADLVVGLFMIPMWLYVVNVAYYRGAAITKRELRAFSFMDQSLVLTSIYHLMYLHCLRSYSIVYPIQHRKMSKRPVLLAIIIIWAICTAFPPVTKMFVIPKSCKNCYVYVNLTTNIGTPLVIVCVANFLLWRRVAKSARQHQKKDTKALITIGILIGLLGVCFIPIFVAAIFEQAGIYFDTRIILVLKILHFSNSGLNPVVYAWRNPDLKRTIQKLICWQATHEANTSGTALENNQQRRMAPSTIS